MSRFVKILPLIFLLFLSPQAFAHAKMAKSVPVDGAVVAEAVSTLELVFSMPVRLTLIEIEHSETGAKTLVAKDLPDSFAKDAIVPVDPLGAGDYEIHWTAVATDGHLMKGKFSFRVED